jgi:hypothetical protein
LIANSNKKKGHFSSIVRLALADGFCPEEKEFLDKLAIRLEISIAEYVEILENFKVPYQPSLLKLNEIERCTI